MSSNGRPDTAATSGDADESSRRVDSSATVAFGTSRRAVLTALGVGAVASTAGCSGALGTLGSSSRAPAVDPQFGYSVPGGQSIPSSLAPDYTVPLHVEEEKIDTSDLPAVTVAFGAFHFHQAGLHVEPGSVVAFEFTSPEHTVTAYHGGFGRQQRVPSGVPALSSPVIDTDGYWLYRFDEPGVYDLFCAPHDPFGMAMRLVVGDPDDLTVVRTPKGRPPAGLSAALLGTGFDGDVGIDALDPANVVASGEVLTDDVLDAVPLEITMSGPARS